MKIKGVFLSTVLASVLCFSGNLLAYSGDGDGTSEEPYQISSVEDWQELMASSGDWSSYFILTADINLAGVALTPVGNGSTPFTGVFDGNGNVISNALINQPSSYHVGLFGYIDGGQIHNLGVEDVNITGYYRVGGLVGCNNYGTITACYTTGSVTGGEYLNLGGLMGANSGTVTGCYSTASASGDVQVGGLMGANGGGTVTDCYATGSCSGNELIGGLVGCNASGSITNCYATGSVSGNEMVGGLVGRDFEGTVTDCYATGSVTGGYDKNGGLMGLNSGTVTACYASGSVSGEGNTGGLMGTNYGTVTACFWDIETSGQATSDGGTGKSTVEMKTLSTFTSAGWDFVDETINGTDDIWTINENVDYPKHVWSLANSNGDGTPENPYQISSVEDWQLLMASPEDWSSCFILTADINLAGVILTPVGNITTQFTGVFNGNDNVISNAEINQPSSYRIGLFGNIGGDCQIHDLGVENVNMIGYRSVGGLAGTNGYYNNGGNITSCYVTGSVNSIHGDVGGLVGHNASYGTITDCYATASVNAMDDNVGGLVAFNRGTIIDCYTNCSVSGEVFIGGLAGSNDGMIIGCHAIGSVIGEGESIGGLLGYNRGTLTGCYMTGSVSGVYNIGGLVGRDDGGTVTACYVTGSVSGTDWVGGLIGGNMGTVTACYATGSVSGEEEVGGLLGVNSGTVTDCYAAGSVSGEVSAGGLVARNYYGYGTITGCFWDIETSGQITSEGGTGKSTVEMKTLSIFTYAGWDFVETWGIEDNQTYPFLKLTYPVGDLNYDRVVNFCDFEILIEHWMDGI